jgi:DGQHR domain-containing protein
LTNVELYAIEGKSFGLITYRGYAKLSDLARISRADVYDDQKNKGGIQRDLDKAHALKAYQYAATGKGKLGEYRLWPEVVLNVRDPSVVTKEAVNKVSGLILTKLTFDPDKMDLLATSPQVSRVDGNHRLFYAEGDDKANLTPVEEITPFSMTIGLDVAGEQALFADVNRNQKGMNTSHLHNINYRLTPQMKIMETAPELWISEKLHEDSESPFLGRVYKGGVRSQGSERYINLTSFKNGIELLLSSGKTLKTIPGSPETRVSAQYLLIRNYWNAVKKIYSSDWNKDTLLLKGVGYRAMSIAGGDIIDRCLAEHKTSSKDMESLVERTQKTKLDDGSSLDWSKNGPLKTYGGMKGVGLLADRILASITPMDQSTVDSLAKEAGLPEVKA